MRRPRELLRRKILIGLALLIGAVPVTLRCLGLIRPFRVPNGSMAPAVAAGDHLMMEGITYLTRKPRRGDIVVFRTDGIDGLPPNTIYLKRTVGEPGERLRIAHGKILVNDTHVPVRNATGEINYVSPRPTPLLASSADALTIPGGHYFVLGDNSANSLDSRYFGFVPERNIIGRISVCYWPISRVGTVE